MVQEIKDLNICSSFKIIGDEASIFFHLFGYFVDNNLVGLLEFNHMYERIEIVNIFVIDQYRNKGIGTSLMEKLISYGKDNKCYNITLEVNHKNSNAISLYHKFGFVDVAKRNGYYDGVDGILMELIL